MRIARVFPRKTNATPDDELSFVGPPQLLMPAIDQVHISVAFSYDLEEAEKLAEQWRRIAPVVFGGPATGDPGDDFSPGMYLKLGYVITSRGCPNHCWFCEAWRREGQQVRELPITAGWNVLDSNLLACSDDHIRAVFKMLSHQKSLVTPVQFTGGLEAARLKAWHVDLLWELKPDQMFFAYDTRDDFEPLVKAGEMLRYADFTRRHMRCYVLVGYGGDTIAKASKRLMLAWQAGFLPMAMLYRDKKRVTASVEWERFQREWARPAIVRANMRRCGVKGYAEVAI